MATQKKKYRSSTNRSRGGVKGKCLDTSAIAHGHTPKDYSRNLRSFHGGKVDEAMDALSKQIIRKKTRG